MLWLVLYTDTMIKHLDWERLNTLLKGVRLEDATPTAVEAIIEKLNEVIDEVNKCHK